MFACVCNVSLVSLAAIFWIFIFPLLVRSMYYVLRPPCALPMAPKKVGFSTDEGGVDHVWNSLSEVLEDLSVNVFSVELGMVVLSCHFLKPFCDKSGKNLRQLRDYRC